MDSLNRVRELRRPVASDVSVARAALAAEMAGARGPRRRHTGARVSAALVGCLLVGGATAGSLTGFFEPGGMQTASAAPALLNRAAVNVAEYDFDLAPGQYLATTVTSDRVVYVHPEEERDFRPFSDIAQGALAAVTVTDTRTAYRPEDPEWPTIISTSTPYPAEVLGDVEAADSVMAQAFPGSMGEDPSYVYEEWNGEYPDALPSEGGAVPEAAPPRPGQDFPTDPADFLAAWEQYAPTGVPGQLSATDLMLQQLAYDVFGSVLDASGEYRATYLRALALADDVRIASTDGDVAVFEVETPLASYRLTVDTARGLVQELEASMKQTFDENGSLTPVGTSPLLPEGSPTMTVTVTQEVVDNAPAVDPIPSE